jgi:hypothetical protein
LSYITGRVSSGAFVDCVNKKDQTYFKTLRRIMMMLITYAQ